MTFEELVRQLSDPDKRKYFDAAQSPRAIALCLVMMVSYVTYPAVFNLSAFHSSTDEIVSDREARRNIFLGLIAIRAFIPVDASAVETAQSLVTRQRLWDELSAQVSLWYVAIDPESIATLNSVVDDLDQKLMEERAKNGMGDSNAIPTVKDLKRISGLSI